VVHYLSKAKSKPRFVYSSKSKNSNSIKGKEVMLEQVTPLNSNFREQKELFFSLTDQISRH